MDTEPDTMEGRGHGLLLPFDTDDPEFARGFELGRLWALLRAEDGPLEDECVHVANAEMVLRVAEATGRGVCSEELDEHWMAVAFGAAEEVLEADGL